MFRSRPTVAIPTALLVVLLGSLIAIAAAQAQTIQDMYVTDGVVYAVARDGNTLYLGGDFSRVGRATGSGVPVDATTGLAQAIPKVVGEVLTAVPDGSGGWFIGGVFWNVTGVPRYSLAHLLSDYSLAAWNPNTNGPVRALAVANGVVYAAGNFTSIGGQSRINIAALDPVTGLATAWNPNASALSHIYALAVDGGTVYAGGDFTSIGGQPASRLAALDAVTGLAANWFPNPDGTVYALAVSGGIVYAGGEFAVISGQPRNRIAAINASPALAIATAWNPNSSDEVEALAVSGGTVYAGGYFTGIGGQARSHIAALDATSGLATGWNPSANYNVWALTVSGSTVYAGGEFTNVGGQDRLRVAALDAVTGAATAWNPTAFSAPYLGTAVKTVAVDGGTVFVGGNYVGLGGLPRLRLAALDATTGIATPWDPGANAKVYAIAPNGGAVYVGGDFTTIGGQGRNRVAAIDAATGLPTAWDPNVSSGQTVRSLAVDGGTVYAGGQFTAIGGQPRKNIAAIDAVSGLATGWNPGMPPAGLVVYTIVPSGGTVYVGGTFANIGGQPRANIAELDAVTALATPWNPSASTTVKAIVPSAGTVYVGGSFSTIGGQSRSRIAAIDAATGLASAWNPNVTNCCATAIVNGIVVEGGKVYLGGVFEAIGGQSRLNLGAIDQTTALPGSWVPDPSAQVFSLRSGGGALYAGGVFENAAGYPQASLAGFITAAVDVPGRGRPVVPAFGSLRLSPNPTGGPLLIEYSLEREARVTIGLYDLQGREVARVLDGVRAPGQRAERWSPADARLPIGLYVVRVSAEGRAETRRVAFLR